jgi:hypothetical protein
VALVLAPAKNADIGNACRNRGSTRHVRFNRCDCFPAGMEATLAGRAHPVQKACLAPYTKAIGTRVSRILDHLETFYDALAGGRHFALTRYADGEAAILQGRELESIGSNRNWCWRPSRGIGDTTFSQELSEALDCSDQNYCIGISCPCCGPADYSYYVNRISSARLQRQVTYSNLFSNGAWKYLKTGVVNVVSGTRRTIVLVTHWNKDFARAKSILTENPVEVLAIGAKDFDGRGPFRGGAVRWYCAERAVLKHRFSALASSIADAIFLVQAGPLANILIHQMFLANPRNTYLDMGHSLDPILYGNPSRVFHTREDALPLCADMDVDWSRDFLATKS